MNRRKFLKTSVVSAVAVGAAQSLPKLINAAAAKAAQGAVAKGYDVYTIDYASFCALPANERIFYVEEGNWQRIVPARLDEKTWSPSSLFAMFGYKNRVPVPGGSASNVPMVSPLRGLSGRGPYRGNAESWLANYKRPDWFTDAKFGIWNHWGPQCVPEDSGSASDPTDRGGWYGRYMYQQGSPPYNFQCKHYGHPSVFGYKELCAQWTLLNWNPEELMVRYKKAGARFFFALASHHDGFDTWSSRHQPWNALRVGPHRDVLGIWAGLARKHGMRFGATFHNMYTWDWFQTSHGADASGPLAGVAYDGRLTRAQGKGQWWEGLDPQMLYGPKHPLNALPDVSFVKNFYDRARDLIDRYNPDLIYFDGSFPAIGWGGMETVAYFLNHTRVNGRDNGVVTGKYTVPTDWFKAVTNDLERGRTSQIMPYPWLSETCLGNWFYSRYLYNEPGTYGGYLKPAQIIHWLVDVVSKNGTFVLNIPGRPDGTIDDKEERILDEIGGWMSVNGEAIYETRPWKIFGQKAGKDTGPYDIFFTRNKANTVVNAFFMGWPNGVFNVSAFGTAAATCPGKIVHVELLGGRGKLTWQQTTAGLTAKYVGPMPAPGHYATVLKVVLS